MYTNNKNVCMNVDSQHASQKNNQIHPDRSLSMNNAYTNPVAVSNFMNMNPSESNYNTSIYCNNYPQQNQGFRMSTFPICTNNSDYQFNNNLRVNCRQNENYIPYVNNNINSCQTVSSNIKQIQQANYSIPCQSQVIPQIVYISNYNAQVPYSSIPTQLRSEYKSPQERKQSEFLVSPSPCFSPISSSSVGLTPNYYLMQQNTRIPSAYTNQHYFFYPPPSFNNLDSTSYRSSSKRPASQSPSPSSSSSPSHSYRYQHIQPKLENSSLKDESAIDHILCSYCFHRLNIKPEYYLRQIQCTHCGKNFIVFPRFVHTATGQCLSSEDVSLELPCIRNITNYHDRANCINMYYHTMFTAKNCIDSTTIRECHHTLMNIIAKIDKQLTRDEQCLQSEVHLVLSSLLLRVEYYLEGNIHCYCQQPYIATRYYIQCDVCDHWYHTSCVNIDTRKLGYIEEYTCRWCDPSFVVVYNEKRDESMLTTCPICKKVFHRPCNLSRHLKTYHNIRWDTHVQLNADADTYLQQQCDYETSFENETPTKKICDGCVGINNELFCTKYPISKKQVHYLLRRLKSKPITWWLHKRLRIQQSDSTFVDGEVCGMRPRGELNVRVKSEIVLVNNIFGTDPKVWFPILNYGYLLELWNAVPNNREPSVIDDLRFFRNRYNSIVCYKKHFNY